MVTFKNNNTIRRNNFRRSDRSFKGSQDRAKLNNNFSNNENFQRKPIIRNMNNISKLIEKYNNMAREALSSGDKILSENYFQHADHFTRLLEEQENLKKSRYDIRKNPNQNLNSIDKKNDDELKKAQDEIQDNKVINS